MQSIDTCPHTCSVCDRSFKTKGGLSVHSNIHRYHGVLECIACDMRFPIRFIYDEHMTKHKQDKDFKCDVCGKAFKSKYRLGSHINTHKEGRDNKCAICNKAFRSKNGLNLHINTHGDINLYSKCKGCYLSFEVMKSLSSPTGLRVSEKVLLKRAKSRYVDEGRINSKCIVCSKLFRVLEESDPLLKRKGTYTDDRQPKRVKVTK